MKENALSQKNTFLVLPAGKTIWESVLTFQRYTKCRETDQTKAQLPQGCYAQYRAIWSAYAYPI